MKLREFDEFVNSLKPCPFCGDKATVEPFQITKWRIRCKNFHCGGMIFGQSSPEQSREIWNKRQ